MITSLSSLSVTSSTTTMVNSLPQPNPPAVSSQSPLDPTSSDVPENSSVVHHTTTSAIITNAFSPTPLSLPTSSPGSSTPPATLFGKGNVSNSIVDTSASHGPLIMSAQTQNEVSLIILCLFRNCCYSPTGLFIV